METLDEQLKKEKAFLKLIAYGFPVMIAIIGAVYSFLLYASSTGLEPFEIALRNKNATITLCEGIELERQDVVDAFEDLYFLKKMSGSHPSKFHKLFIQSASLKADITIGQDSRRAKLFWVNSTYGILPTMTLGYIESEAIKSKLDEC